ARVLDGGGRVCGTCNNESWNANGGDRFAQIRVANGLTAGNVTIGRSVHEGRTEVIDDGTVSGTEVSREPALHGRVHQGLHALSSHGLYTGVPCFGCADSRRRVRKNKGIKPFPLMECELHAGHSAERNAAEGEPFG